nr:putative RNA-directed DNA polymerase, eukaryota [Tanacetum cinerariifolium]
MALKTWSKERYMGLDVEIETARKEADLWEKEAENRTLQDYELGLWQKALADWIEKDGIKAKMLKQKARIHWYEEGDENSKYFHAKVRKRYRKNGLRGLMVDGMWCENPATIKQIVFEYFKGVYLESDTGRPKFSNRFKRLSEIKANLLEAEFEEKEVWEAIKSCGSSKAPGLDGFNFKFMKKVLRNHKASYFRGGEMVLGNERISRGCNSPFVALIPKIVDPIGLGGSGAGGFVHVLRRILLLSLLMVLIVTKDKGNDGVEGARDSKPIMWVKWEKALANYEMGGLNTGSLKAMNWALLSKWWWRFQVENEALWVKVIKSKDLGKIGINLASTVKWKVEDGKAILFWDDMWKKNVKDKCMWVLSEDDKFSVKDLRDLIDEKTLGYIGRQFATP